MQTVNSFLAKRPDGAKCALIQSVMSTSDEDQIRDYLRRAAEAIKTDLTGLARSSGLAPSTLTRFVNGKDGKFLLSTRTLAKVARASGLTPPALGSASGAMLSDAERIHALNAVAEALGLPLEITPRSVAWLDAVGRIPAALEDRAYNLVAGMAENDAPAQDQGRPSEGEVKVRRRG